MILQALKEYYDRKSSDPNSGIASEGFEKKELQFLIVINEKGDFVTIEDTREKAGNNLVAKTFLLPRSKGRSGSKSYETTFLLWDHIGYLLGLPETDIKSAKQHKTWLKSLKELPQDLIDDDGVKAIIEFYKNNAFQIAKQAPQIQECLKSAQCNMSFRLVTDKYPVPCREKVLEYVRKLQKSSEEGENNPQPDKIKKYGHCLVTGEYGETARTHGRTPIDKDTKSLVGIQRNCGYDSYGKEQGYNAPIIKSTEFAYTTALNSLLKSKAQRLQIGDATTVFWSKRETHFEEIFSCFFKEPEKDDPDKNAHIIKSFFQSVKTGVYLKDGEKTNFFVLGLSPNAARISVRFFLTGTIAKFSSKICEYFDDFQIIKPSYEPEYYSIWRILVNISTQDKSENIPPNISEDLMRSILIGTPFPATLLQLTIRRIRSSSNEKYKPIRAAIIKAYLNRYYRFYPDKKVKEICMDLDINQPSVGYQLGRLFATLEKIQEEANPGLNATIRERFYGAACATPVTVFTNLLRLKNHHLAKLENKGRIVNFERLLGEIMGNFNSFPAHLNLHEQGRFAIGYYHQRQAFFTSKETDKDDKQQNNLKGDENE